MQERRNPKPGRPRGARAFDPLPATSFGKAIRERRLIMGMSQEELASLARIERSHVGKLERGEHLPNLLLIFRLAVALDMLPGSLVDRAAELMNQHINKS